MTSSVTPISKEDDCLEAASRWALLIDEGLTERDTAKLKDWLNEDPRHASVLLEVAEAWDKLDSLSRLAELFPMSEDSPQPSPSRAFSRSLRPSTRRWAMAASVLLLLAVSLIAFNDMRVPGFDPLRSAPSVAAFYKTDVGEQKTVLLPDGSEVVLNTSSTLRVEYTDDARVLHLSRGELHVDVAEDAVRPLSVIAGEKIVQALGTEFSVQITDDNQVEVLVTEGKVVVGVRPGQAGSPLAESDQPTFTPPLLAQTNSNTVDAGEALLLGTSDEQVSTLTPDEIEVELSWRKGRLIFQSVPLAEALEEVERYTTVEFILLDEELKAETLSGRFRTGDVNTLLALLEANFQIAHEFDGDQRVLLSSL